MERRFSLVLFALLPLAAPVRAQDRLPHYPGYERFAKMRREIASSVRRPNPSISWTETGFNYTRSGKRYHVDLKTGAETEGEKPALPNQGAGPRPGFRGGGPARGRQFGEAVSPDGEWKAYHQERNLWISKRDGSGARAITTEGSEKTRTKFGIASWVYGEELNQNTAMWWSPDGKRLAYYGFDESQVKDYYLTDRQVPVQSSLDVEPYPKAGAPNPLVDLYVASAPEWKSVKLDIRSGQAFSDDVVGHYAYNVRWSPDGTELLFNRTNRRQNVTEICAADPVTGTCRVVIREEWLSGWTDNSPRMQFLKDGKRFLLLSSRSGFRNIYLHDLSGKLLATVTRHSADVEQIVRTDEERGLLDYMARTGDNPYKLQLHRVRLDGTGGVRLTDPALHHTVQISPNGQAILDIAETHSIAPVARVIDGDGKVVRELEQADLSRFEAAGLQRSELFTFTAADGKTTCYGLLQKPSNFDPSRKYPVLVSVYAGPESSSLSERFETPSPLTELGFLVARFDGRGTSGKGKANLDAVYQKLGVAEIDDQAAGVRELAKRSYVDDARVGIYGTSYGGYASAMSLLRHPDVFRAACAQSSVTDWRNYDTIYTERYMWTPQGNPSGYEAGSAMTHAKNLKGRLMLYWGTADNNVHPSNSLQLIRALQQAGKNFEVQVGPDQGHTGLGQDRMLEFFIESLVLARP